MRKYQSPYLVRVCNFFSIYRMLGYGLLESVLCAIRSSRDKR